MITTEQVKDAPGGAMFGKWVRWSGTAPQLTRRVGGLDLAAFVAKNGATVLWERRYIGMSFTCAHGECDSWEAAMMAAEDSAKRELVSALMELGAEVKREIGTLQARLRKLEGGG